MKTFEEYQALATKVPASLRNNRDRVDLPLVGLQGEAGKLGSLFAKAFASGKFTPTQEQTTEIKDRLGDVLWCVAILCAEAGISMQDLAEHSAGQLQERMKEFDPEWR